VKENGRTAGDSGETSTPSPTPPPPRRIYRNEKCNSSDTRLLSRLNAEKAIRLAVRFINHDEPTTGVIPIDCERHFLVLLLVAPKTERVRKLHNSDSGLDVIRICSFDAHSKNKGESKDEGERGRMINYD
jgi:hypothetical protein